MGAKGDIPGHELRAYCLYYWGKGFRPIRAWDRQWYAWKMNPERLVTFNTADEFLVAHNMHLSGFNVWLEERGYDLRWEDEQEPEAA